MATAKESAREQRARAREERRREESSVDAGEALAGDPGEAFRNAAGAALVGAALGAAKALARRRADADEEEPEPEPELQPEPAPEPEGETETEQDQDEPEPHAQADSTPEPEPEPRRPASAGDAREAVRRARDELRELHGAEADSVSAVTRTSDGWRIGLEVVEVHRVPESTDVLATYEVELTDDGGLLSFERTRRYYRSEADKQ